MALGACPHCGCAMHECECLPLPLLIDRLLEKVRRQATTPQRAETTPGKRENT